MSSADPSMQYVSPRNDETEVYFLLLSELHTGADIRALIGCTVGSIIEKGKPRHPRTPHLLEPRHGLKLSATPPSVLPLEAHLRALMELLTPHAAALRSLRGVIEQDLVCVCYTPHPNLPLHFPQDIASFFGQLECEWYLDLYWLGQGEENR